MIEVELDKADLVDTLVKHRTEQADVPELESDFEDIDSYSAEELASMIEQI